MVLEHFPAARESSFQSAVVDLARRYGWLVMHTRPALNRSGRWSTPLQGDPGFPDLVLAHPTRGVIFAELKTNTGRLSHVQTAWVETLTAAGADTVVWRPQDWRTIAERLTGREVIGR